VKPDDGTRCNGCGTHTIRRVKVFLAFESFYVCRGAQGNLWPRGALQSPASFRSVIDAKAPIISGESRQL
jgi:hypothetical protein